MDILFLLLTAAGSYLFGSISFARLVARLVGPTLDPESIHMTRAQIVRMVLSEAGLMRVIDGVLGVVTGVVLARILFVGMTTMSGYDLTFVLQPSGVVISLAATIFISQVAAVFPARRAAGVKILEAVHYE